MALSHCTNTCFLITQIHYICIPSSVNDASEMLNTQSTLQEVDKQKKKIDNKCMSSTSKYDEVLPVVGTY